MTLFLFLYHFHASLSSQPCSLLFHPLSIPPTVISTTVILFSIYPDFWTRPFPSFLPYQPHSTPHHLFFLTSLSQFASYERTRCYRCRVCCFQPSSFASSLVGSSATTHTTVSTPRIIITQCAGFISTTWLYLMHLLSSILRGGCSQITSVFDANAVRFYHCMFLSPHDGGSCMLAQIISQYDVIVCSRAGRNEICTRQSIIVWFRHVARLIFERCVL